MEIAFYIEEYAKQTKTEKKLTLTLFDHEIKFQRGKYDRVRLKRETLAKYVKCCTKTVSRFNNKVKLFLIAVVEKWKSNGNQGANEYIMDAEFFKALKLLYDNKLLYKSKSEILSFLVSHRENKNVPLALSKCPSSYSPSLSFHVKEYSSGVHSYLDRIEELTNQQRASLSQNPESVIVSSLEDYEWFKTQKKIDDPYGLMIMLTNKWKGKYAQI